MTLTGWILATLALFFAQTLIAPAIRYVSPGLPGIRNALGPRDDPPAMPVIGARFDRALKNMVEAMVVFLPIALLLETKGLASGVALTGAMVFFWARLAYVPAYVSGIPGLRSAIWSIGHIGLAMMIAGLLVAPG